MVFYFLQDARCFMPLKIHSECGFHAGYANRKNGDVFVRDMYRFYFLDRSSTDFSKNGKISSVFKFKKGEDLGIHSMLVVRCSSWYQAKLLNAKYPLVKEVLKTNTTY